MKYLIKQDSVIFIMFWTLVISICLALVSPAKAVSPECIGLTYHRAMICEYPPGRFTNYTAGIEEVVLTGNVPPDNSWDKQYFRLYGHLVENGSCTMLYVDKAISCSSVNK